MNLREKMVLDLTSGLKTDDWREKVRLLKHMKEIGPEISVAMNNLIDLLSDPDARVRFQAANVLKELGSDLEKVVSTIDEAYKKENDPDVKNSLIDLLGISKSKSAIKFLKQIYDESNNDFIRQSAVESLSFIGDEQCLPYIFKALKDPASNVRYAAANSLRWIKSEEKVQPLIEALQDDNSLVRSGAAWALSTISKKDLAVEPIIIALQNEEDDYVRYDLIKTLGEMKTTKGIPELVSLAKSDPEVKIRLKAIETLGEIGTEDAIKALIDLYRKASTVTIQNKISFALRNVKPEYLNEFEKLRDQELKDKELKKHQKEIEALHNYRISELQNILLNHKSMSIELFAELLKIKDVNNVEKWLQDLPENLGIRIIQQIDFDSILITTHNDPKVMYDKINKIIASFSAIFETVE
ncbi:MAG: HEAT repeat domain-containing protein [Asgard group archaeon]|nr:HEAT repeat domain-containing protein [Asgard group archaeon]